jgi:type I restriction enzyme R subunit
VKISAFETVPLIEVLVNSGLMAAVATLPDSIKSSEAATAETITNNVRSTIVERRVTDPAYYQKMSTLLDQIVSELKARQIDYAAYLKKVAELAKKVQSGTDNTLPARLTTPGTRALYNNLAIANADERVETAIGISEAVTRVRQADWRGNHRKEQEIKQVIFQILGDDDQVEQAFGVIKKQGEF